MKYIIGYGNEQRGEDAFGIDVIKELDKYKLYNTSLLSVFQLTPEMVFDLLEAEEIIFIDACYSEINHYKLACSIIEQNNSSITHYISPKEIISMLNIVYAKYPLVSIYSMLTNRFDEVFNDVEYKIAVKETATFIKSLEHAQLHH